MAGLLAAATETVMATWTKLNNDNEYEFLPARRSASAVFATATSCPSVCLSRCCIETDKDIIKGHTSSAGDEKYRQQITN